MRWLELSCRADREAAEAVGELFARYGRGVVLEDVDCLDGETVAPPESLVTLRTYLSLDETAEEKRREIQHGLWVLGMIRTVSEMEERDLAEEDWAEAWKAHFHVHRVGRRLVVKPTWRAYEPGPEDLVIELDPGMAFGTGLHPTTQLCLAALEDHLAPGQRVLDLGTGSGILAVAAAKLGAASVVALDTDPVAVDAARANVAANGLEGTVAVGLGTLMRPEPGPTYDLIVANIIARVIRELAPHLGAALAPGGALIASGILAEREAEVASALADAGLTLVERRQDGDWLALVVRRADPDASGEGKHVPAERPFPPAAGSAADGLGRLALSVGSPGREWTGLKKQSPLQGAGDVPSRLQPALLIQPGGSSPGRRPHATATRGLGTHAPRAREAPGERSGPIPPPGPAALASPAKGRV